VPAHVGLKLDLGEPESPHTPRYAPAIFGALSAEDAYDATVEAGHEESSSGSTSTAYAGRYGAFSIIPEVPFWTDPSADDTRETDTLYADVLRRQSAQLTELASTLEGAHEQAAPALKLDTPLLRAGRAFAGAMGRVAEDAARRAEEAASARPATAAEVRSCGELVHVFRTRFAGILARALDAEIRAGVAAPAVRAAHARLSEAFEAWCEEAKDATSSGMLPIRSLVATQLGAVLAAALWLRDQPV
jgi:hypothetical protein